MNHKLESRFQGEISITSNIQMIMAESKDELKSLLMRVKEESEKPSLKLSFQNTNIMASNPITLWQIEGEKLEVVTDFIFLGSKITVDANAAMKLKDACSLEGRL